MPARPRPPTYLAELDEISPIMCYLSARQNRSPITQAQLAILTGFGKNKVAKICGLKSWANVTVEDADKFRIACGITRVLERRHRYYLKMTLNETPNGFNHLRKQPGRVTRATNKVKKVLAL